MAEGEAYSFDRKSVDRIIRAVRAVEAGQPATQPGKRGPNDLQVIVAVLTATNTDKTKYSFEQRRWKAADGTWEAVAGGITGDHAKPHGYAVNPDGSELATGGSTTPVVLARTVAKRADGKPAVVWTVANDNSKGTHRYMVHQMTTDTTKGWDWVRFH